VQVCFLYDRSNLPWVVMAHNGDDRDATVREYLREAAKCEALAARENGDQQRSWLELAERFRRLAAMIKGEQ
jgi:hypothetical protein